MPGTRLFRKIGLDSPLRRRIYVKIAVAQVPPLAQKQIPEETLQIDGGVVNAFDEILIIRTDKGVAEVPGVVCEQAVVYVEAGAAQVLDGKYGCRACVSFTEGMNLPDS